MKIEVFVIQFYRFCPVEWAEVSIEIKALNMFSLRRAFLNEFSCDRKTKKHILSYPDHYYEGKKKEIRQIWNDNKKHISKETIEFPLIDKHKLRDN